MQKQVQIVQCTICLFSVGAKFKRSPLASYSNLSPTGEMRLELFHLH